jgi:hypothetical protein
MSYLARIIRRFVRPVWFGLLVFVLIGAPPQLRAEAPSADAKATAPAAGEPAEQNRPKGRIQYVGPDTYILLDAEGRPQAVPGMTYEDFLAAWKNLNQPAIPDSQPRFTIESVKFDGKAFDQKAALEFEATVRHLTNGPIDVPLGLVGAILQSEVRFQNLDEFTKKAGSQPPSKDANNKSKNEYLDFNPQEGGFVARMVGRPAERQTIAFKLVVPLTRDGSETTLALNCPRSASSTLALDVDSPVNEVRGNSGVVMKKSASESGTKIEVAGPAGQFRLSWQSARKDPAALASVLNAVGAIHVAIDGRGMRSDARLTVRSFSGSFDQFRVRLPRGAKLIRDPAVPESQDAKYRITEELQPLGSKNEADSSGQIALVELKEKQQGPVEVNLSTEQSGHDVGQLLPLGGFEVLGAVRQYGDIGLNVANDWQARWDIGRDIRQVDPNELDASLQRADLTAAFQYDGQPWSMAVRISPRQSRVHVTPKYELELLPDEARLTARLNYQIFGARAYKFVIELNGWETTGEPVEAGGLVNQDRVPVPTDGRLTLPLAQGTSRKAEVTIPLRRSLGRDTSKLQLPLPVPTADSVGTGELTVRVPPEIELIPDLSNSSGLATSPAPEASSQNATNTSTELHFRTLVPNAVFAGERSNRSRQVSAQISNKVEFAQDAVQIAQTFNYDVRFEPVKELIFEASADVPMESEGVDISLITPTGSDSNLGEQRTPLRFEPVPDENDFATEAHRWRVILPQPQLGKFTIGAQYRLPRLQKLAAVGAMPVPLLSAVDLQTATSRAIVTTAPGLSVSLDAKAEGSSWKTAEPRPKTNGATPGHEYVSDRTEPTLPLVVSTAEAKAPSTTIVDRVWLQSWLTNDVEQDRAAFRFRTTGTETTVELPPGAPQDEIEVLLDGKPAEISSHTLGRIVVRLGHKPNAAAGETAAIAHTLEIRFRYGIQQPLVARHRLTPPQIDGTKALTQVYWQIVLPGDEHIIQAPGQLTSASQWQWLGSFWGQRPVMAQPDLESWSGASAQIAASAGNNQYLFTGLLPVSTIELVTAPRWLVVLVASAVGLSLVIGWYYLPVAARSGALVALVIVIAATAVSYPTAALLIAQAAVLGLVLGMLSMLLTRYLMRPRQRLTPSAMAASSQRMITPRAESIVMPPVIAAASTAPTVTLRGSESDR